MNTLTSRGLLLLISMLFIPAFLYGTGTLSHSEVTVPEPIQPEVVFDEKEFALYFKKGTASITGQAFLPTMGEEARYNPGGFVYLVPATKWTEAWFRKAAPEKRGCKGTTAEPEESQIAACKRYLERFILPDEKRVGPYVRVTRMNPNGHFWFSKLPPGKYYITTVITWPAGGQPNGGIAMAYVEVEAGEHVSDVIASY